VLAGLGDAEITTLADPDSDDAEVTAIVTGAEAGFVEPSDEQEETAEVEVEETETVEVEDSEVEEEAGGDSAAEPDAEDGSEDGDEPEQSEADGEVAPE
jgi:hypothetical protein